MIDRNARVDSTEDVSTLWQPKVGAQAAGTHGPAIFSMDARGFVSSWNDRSGDILGYSGKEIIGEHCSVFYPGERVEAQYPQWELQQAACTGLYMDQGWRVRKDGSRFWATVSVTSQRSDDGSLHGYITVIRDETEERARHQRSSQRFTELFDLAPVGIGLFDEHDRVLHANNALCELLGYQLEELHGMHGAELLQAGERAGEIVPPSFAPYSSSRHPPVQQRTLVRADGEPMICDVHSAVSMEDSGTPFWQVVFQDVTEQHRRAELLHHRATHDGLTGLPNHAGIHEQLDELLEDHTSGLVAVLFCDLDRFKRVNDSLGHEAGNELLVTLARRLESELPESCVAARLFGDEFLVACSDLDAAGGLDELTNLVSGLLDTVVSVQGQPVWLSASIGAAVVERAGTTSQDLVRLSDSAMFAAKNQNPGGVVVADEGLVDSTNGQLREEEQLRETVLNDGLTLQYQPIVAQDGSIVLAEALMRWRHPQRGMVGPDFILPIAEQGNLMRELDRSVLRIALREAATWPPVGGNAVPVAVNLGGLLPDDPHFAKDISALIDESGIEWNRVVLEVVETSLNELSTQRRQDMFALSERGVRFAIDDFGIAYSSLKRLKELPAQYIKIDREFVSGVDKDSSDLTIARAVVDMSQGLGCGCIAEGVETAEQFHLLDSLGVEKFQGYLFSKPVPASEFRALLDTGAIPMPRR